MTPPILIYSSKTYYNIGGKQMDNQTKSSHGYHRRNNKRNANRSVEPEIMDSAISSESIGSNGTVNKSLVDVISHEATVNLDAQQRLTET